MFVTDSDTNLKKKTLELYIEPLKNALLYREIIDAESLV